MCAFHLLEPNQQETLTIFMGKIEIPVLKPDDPPWSTREVEVPQNCMSLHVILAVSLIFWCTPSLGLGEGL